MMRRWFWLIAILSATCVAEVIAYISAQWQPGDLDNDVKVATGKPSWRSLSRIGHELLAKNSHQYGFFPWIDHSVACSPSRAKADAVSRTKPSPLPETDGSLADDITSIRFLCRSSSKVQASDPYVKDWPNTIAICAVMKAERAQDVKEFIDYHR